MVVICGPGSEEIGSVVASILEVESSVVEHRVFTDGEDYLRLTTDVTGRDVVLVHSMGPPQDRRLVQLLLILDALREGGAGSVELVAPYLAYARQDRGQLPGEAVSAFTVMKLLRYLGVSRLVTVNVHNPDVFKGAGFELTDFSAIPLLADYLRGEGLEECFSLSLGNKPIDIRHAEEAAAVLGGSYARLRTFRDPSTGEVRLDEPGFTVRGERAAIFDDVITSGGTHLQVVELLQGMGVEEVHLACVHSLLSEERLRDVLDATDSFTCTDTVPSRCSRVGVAPLIAGALAERG